MPFGERIGDSQHAMIESTSAACGRMPTNRKVLARLMLSAGDSYLEFVIRACARLRSSSPKFRINAKKR
ncbi:hypothetical protein AWB83_03342 [Caballeronia ptereochthonis]|uniref:Uncharacterized protein n=1 Tax=Caballeronia ptereochthonis TaxID=1777144 RepID=A0A158BJZ0_9BURK|nr:hypothetical protein AWB83_03342 [Caballeronia ptereochthonis]